MTIAVAGAAPAAAQGSLGLALAQGATGGYSAGFVGGSLNAWLNGASFWDGFAAGMIGGSIGAVSGMALAGAAHGLAKAWDAMTAGEYVPSKQSLDVSGAMKDARAEVGFFEPDDGSMIDDWVAVKLKRGELTDFFHSVRKSARSGDPYILHDGVDLAAAYGTEVPAQGGRAWSGYNTKWGLHVFEEKGGVRHLYAHLSKTHIRFGQIRVMTAGEVIGRVGMTGNTTGPHLHYGILSLRNQRFINPYHYRFMNGTELW